VVLLASSSGIIAGGFGILRSWVCFWRPRRIPAHAQTTLSSAIRSSSAALTWSPRRCAETAASRCPAATSISGMGARKSWRRGDIGGITSRVRFPREVATSRTSTSMDRHMEGREYPLSRVEELVGVCRARTGGSAGFEPSSSRRLIPITPQSEGGVRHRRRRRPSCGQPLAARRTEGLLIHERTLPLDCAPWPGIMSRIWVSDHVWLLARAIEAIE
jgi:hypothetical protein